MEDRLTQIIAEDIAYSGLCYRGRTETQHPAHRTAQDICDYDENINLEAEIYAELVGIPARQLIWVTKQVALACKYGSPTAITVPPSLVLTVDRWGGMLLLLPYPND